MTTTTELDLRSRLRDLATNLWWTWTPSARKVLEELDPEAWEAQRHDPLAVIDGLDSTFLQSLADDEKFMNTLEEVFTHRHEALEGETWFDRTFGEEYPDLCIAYFCSEYGLHESIPQYAGGLGILAGDHLRSASDLGVPLVGVGIVYHHGYYLQRIEQDGSTRVEHPEFDPSRSPMQDTGRTIDCPMGDTMVRVKIWRMDVGRCALYLLDTDLPENSEIDRELSNWLYGGDPNLRMRRQVLLGIGGILALNELGIPVTVTHLNEGHAAFACVQRIREAIESGMDHDAAMDHVRNQTVFTTHTPVPAGHDRYDPGMVEGILRPITSPAGIDSGELLDLGREHPGAQHEPFCMTVLALKCASSVNAVSRLHRRVTKEMWQDIYGLRRHQAIPITHVTNGIHINAWIDEIAHDFWKEHGIDIDSCDPDANPWLEVGTVEPADLWALRGALRSKFVTEVRRRAAHRAARIGQPAPESLLDPETLTIGFARRFATYKRALLVFHDLERLGAILSNAEKPVQIVFAGKAHPDDQGGQEYLRRIVEISETDPFRGRVVVLEEYDIGLGRALVSGTDLWLNTPMRPREASGTSGMKAPIHGGMNLSILDGWWPEASDGTNGWHFGSTEEFDDPEHRDHRDAEELYALLESEIVPAFYDREPDGLPLRWLHRVRRSAVTVPGVFNTHRMVGQYLRAAYLPTHNRCRA